MYEVTFTRKKRSVCYSEHSEESMQLFDITGFFAMLRMTGFDVFVEN
jgi:hypothetical protein